ncbi:MAG: hypothetical protein GWN58_23200 [Anaerolineae bacterium]|nr:hypothetical protein [Thermoplasmata archaeon]NIV32263.1 hypothetical protein [Anaerolineae bacterium]NIY03716.1 hypothetical protein [Thermoplasmata archaeon]
MKISEFIRQAAKSFDQWKPGEELWATFRSESMWLFFTPKEKLKNGNYKGLMVTLPRGRPKKAKKYILDKHFARDFTIIDKAKVPPTVMKKFQAAPQWDPPLDLKV